MIANMYVCVCVCSRDAFLQNFFGQLIVVIISSSAVGLYNAFLARWIRFLLSIVQGYKLYLFTYL